MLEHGERMYRDGSGDGAAAFLRAFRAGVHSAHETPDVLPDWLERGATLAAHERPPWEAEPPLEELARAPFPKLVISGGHSPVFEAVCDRLAERIGGERRILTGRQHTIPTLGRPCTTIASRKFMTRSGDDAPMRASGRNRGVG